MNSCVSKYSDIECLFKWRTRKGSSDQCERTQVGLALELSQHPGSSLDRHLLLSICKEDGVVRAAERATAWEVVGTRRSASGSAMWRTNHFGFCENQFVCPFSSS
jgi:hypothetical protein